MNFINKILDNQNSSIGELIECLDIIREKGDVVVVKIDGERHENAYTVFVTFPRKDREMIRADEDDLKHALISVLRKYVELG